MSETKTAEQLAAETKAAFDKRFDEVKAIAEEALGKAAKGEKLSEGIKEKADEALLKMSEVKGQLTELEQKLARGGEKNEAEEKSIGQQFVESEQFKAFEAAGFSKGVNARAEFKATLTTSTAAAAGSLGAGIAPTRLPGVVELPRRQMTIRALLGQGQMDGNTIEWVQEHSANLAAAMVAEGALKPESDFRLSLQTTSARVIAHYMKASRQALSDVSALRSMIDVRLRYGLDLVEENQLLNGDGTGQNLLGLIPQATAFSAPHAVTAQNQIDILRLAALQANLALLPADGVSLHPTDWSVIETLKDSQGRYLIGNPQGTLAPTIWGMPVVPSMAMTVDKFLVGAFQTAAQIFDRWETSIETGYVNDDFQRNLVTILGEKRLVLATYRPQAFIFGDFGRVA